ncbi:uncharacterized protein LOC107639968 [Arachis ipaensis]|uniref:uncharacterized protein LOC107639968 n=1 Tax=Arachis ipaensis TaxID=130454 RepID=UPI0007AF4E7D|nr:uncharacterized protein LOC107639968 [Arachis ipaensis]
MSDSVSNDGSSPGFDVHTLSHLLNQFTHLQSQLNYKNMSPFSDPSSVFFLHHSKNPRVSIISVKLDTKNYNEWSRAILIALKSKNKLGFVDGTLTKLSVDYPNFSAWDKSVDIWNDLRHRYYQGDIFKIAELEEKLFSLKQWDSSTTDYFTKLKAIWEEVENFKSIPLCIACESTCICGLEKLRIQKKETYTVRFFRGLNEKYHNVRSQIMLSKPLPDVNEVFSLLRQQERHLNLTDENVHDPQIVLTAANSDSFVNRDRNSRFDSHGRGGSGRSNRGMGRGNFGRGYPKICSFCNKVGHLVDVCYQKHGFPPHMKQQPRSASINMAVEKTCDDKSSPNST